MIVNLRYRPDWIWSHLEDTSDCVCKGAAREVEPRGKDLNMGGSTPWVWGLA